MRRITKASEVLRGKSPSIPDKSERLFNPVSVGSHLFTGKYMDPEANIVGKEEGFPMKWIGIGSLKREE